jgi:hypothetical protein
MAKTWKTIKSDGRSVRDLIAAVESKGRELSKQAKEIIAQPGFKITTETTYRLAVIRGNEFGNRECTTPNILAQAAEQRLRTPPAEVGLILGESTLFELLGGEYTRAQLEDWSPPFLVIMHEPVLCSDGESYLLSIERLCGVRELLSTCSGRSENSFYKKGIFVFLQDEAEQVAGARPVTSSTAGGVGPVTEGEAVEVLLALYNEKPEGYWPGFGPDYKSGIERIREIGESLNKGGGMERLLRVHAEFARRTRVFGAARNLESLWDRIGEWRG